MSNLAYEKPRWLRDFARFLPLKSQFVLSGNVRDLQIVETAPGILAPVPLAQAVHQELKSAGYGATLVYDLVSGFGSVGSDPREAAAGRQVMERVGLGAGNAAMPTGPTVLLDVITRLSGLDGPPVGLIVDFASRLLIRADALSEGEQRLFTNAFVQSHRARPRPVGPNRTPAFNTIVWVVEREGSLPDWLIIDNPRMRHIPVAKPDNQARAAIAPQLLGNMPGGSAQSTKDAAATARDF